MTSDRHVVVLGAGLAGMTAAAAAAAHAGRVTLIDRDDLPDQPVPRRGLPQARHAHLMWSGGDRAIESLLPGHLQRLLDAGAHQIGLPDGLVSYSAQGWIRRFPRIQYLVTCSRDLLDWVIRQQLRTQQHIQIRSRIRAIGITGDATRITGVNLRTDDGQEEHLPADLVVDATGVGSHAARWLAELGLPPVREEQVDSGLAYATRIFRAPPDAVHGFPLVNVQADHRQPIPGQTATIVPIENGQWLVTLSGTRGGQPSTDEAEFISFARQVRHPIVANLISHLQPLTPVYGSHGTANWRRYFEKLPAWPAGFLVIGDAVASYNPIYGQGMSVAAQCAQQLHEALQHDANTPANVDTRKLQKAIGRIVDTPWLVATGQDLQYPGAIGKPPPKAARLFEAYMQRLILAATGRPEAAQPLYDAMTFNAPMTRLIHPKTILAAIRGPGQPPLTEPPLTTHEWTKAGLTHPTHGMNQ